MEQHLLGRVMKKTDNGYGRTQIDQFRRRLMTHRIIERMVEIQKLWILAYGGLCSKD